jgi:hypothetical protein
LVTPAANTTAVPHVTDTAALVANTAAPVANTAAPVANTAAQGLNASGGTGQRSNPSISCTPMYVGVPSMAAELDVVKVTHFFASCHVIYTWITKRRWLNLRTLLVFRRPRAPTFLALSYITSTAC